MYRVYCLKEKATDKIIYIGITKQKLANRVYKHYKEKNLSRSEYYHEILEEYSTKDEALKRETELILYYNLIEEGYNKVSYVGENAKNNQETHFKKDNDFGKMGTKKVECIELKKQYNSITECAKDMNLSISKVSAVCKGQRKTHKGYSFKFV